MLFRVVALLLLVVIAYIPACQGDFIWDDDFYVSNNLALHDLNGLRDIWIWPVAMVLDPDQKLHYWKFRTVQYYPLVFTTFWVEYQLWGLNPAGYHWVNVVLHGLNAGLLWLLLRRLKVPFPWLAAAIFALHPVNVESVAWITERKNVLSGFFYLIAFLAFLRFSPPREEEGEKGRKGEGARGRRGEGESKASVPSPVLPFSPSPAPPQWGWYAVSLLAFVAALLSKSVTCSLPAVLVLVYWWKRGWPTRRKILALAPMFAIGLALALNTSRIEREFVGARGEDWNFTPVERCLIAGRALWFYVGKLLWPYPLIFNYERWHIDAHQAWQYLFPLGWLAVFAILVLLLTSLPLPKVLAPLRKMGKGPLAACLIFAGTLFPALGFFNVYPMIFYFAADHFQYLASIAMICLATAAIYSLGQRWRWIHASEGKVLAGALLLVLGYLTWQQGYVYHSLDTLWADTRDKNPEAWMAQNNFGLAQAKLGNYVRAIQCFERAIQVNPRSSSAYTNWAFAFWNQAKGAEAAALEAQKTGNDGLAKEKFAAAKRMYLLALEKTKKAVECDRTDDPQLLCNVGFICDSLEDYELAISYLEKALDAIPKYRRHQDLTRLIPQYEYALAYSLLKVGRREEALAHAQRAAEIAGRQTEPHPDMEKHQKDLAKYDDLVKKAQGMK